jgi:hypothetical protein
VLPRAPPRTKRVKRKTNKGSGQATISGNGGIRKIGVASRPVDKTGNGGVRKIGVASRLVDETGNGGVRKIGVASRPVDETGNGGVRKFGVASRHVDETENGAGATTDPFAESFRTKDALEAIPPEWQDNAGTSKGKSLMRPQELASRLLPASICETLHQFASDGVPTDCGPEWPQDVKKHALEAGPHTSAMSPENIELIWDDIRYQEKDGFVHIVTEEQLGEISPPNLKISRVAVVPQTNRRGRIILNLSASVALPSYRPQGQRRRIEPVHPSVNETTAPAADQSAAEALGTARNAILRFMFEVDPTWEIDWQKVDLSDGFWRMIVEHGEAYNFVFQLPMRPGDTTRYFVIPAALQMGWKNSPAYFCLGTEGARELIRRLLALTFKTGIQKPHRHEGSCVAPPTELEAARRQDWTQPSACALFSRCFVDDFMNGLAGEPSRSSRHQEQLWFSRATMHAIHAVFPPPDVTGCTGKDSVSEKKLAKGDATFKVTEELLGFEFCGATGTGRTVGMRKEKQEKYVAQIQNALKQPRSFVTLPAFQSLRGKLGFATNCIPCLRGIMTPLNRGMANNKDGTPPRQVGLPKDSDIRRALGLSTKLLDLMLEQPSHITELVPPDLPHYYGYVDYAACGIGGVLLPCTKWVQPSVWRLKTPPDIEHETRQKHGTISNSDGEAAAVFLQELSLEHWTGCDTRGISTHWGSDNSPTVGWNNRGASRASHRAPETMIWWQALRQRFTRRGPTDVEHVPGKSNRLGDFPSRSFEEGFPDGAAGDEKFLLEFSRRHPLPPQLGSWRLVHPPTEAVLAAYSILRNEDNTQTCPKTFIGRSGVGLPHMLARTLTYTTSKEPAITWNEATCSWPLLGASGTVSYTKAKELQQRRSRQPFANAPGSWSPESLLTLGDTIRPSTN